MNNPYDELINYIERRGRLENEIYAFVRTNPLESFRLSNQIARALIQNTEDMKQQAIAVETALAQIWDVPPSRKAAARDFVLEKLKPFASRLWCGLPEIRGPQ